jgi:flagellar basal body rod protein FlgG
MMGSAQRRLAVTATNLSNMSTPAYRTRRAFTQVVDLREGLPVEKVALARAAAGGLKASGNPLDIAAGQGAVVVLRAGDRFVPVRSAQLSRDGDGRLVDPAGRILQAAGGGDVVIGGGRPTILADGTVLIDQQPAARIGLFAEPASSGLSTIADLDAGLIELPQPAEEARLLQGYLAPSDVDAAAEMVELSKASRLAETGARIFQICDDLLGTAASKLGSLGQ